jgi:hypothetical protein
MKAKIIEIAVVSLLLISCISASGLKLDKAIDLVENTQITEDTIEMNIANMEIDSKETEATVTKNTYVLDLTIPDTDTIQPVKFSFNCLIKNEKLANAETWVFEVFMRKYPAGETILEREIVYEDQLTDSFPKSWTISETVDFSRAYPWERRGMTDKYDQRYSLEVRCEYYDDGVSPGQQAPDDHDACYDDPVVVLANNNPPSAPTLSSDDVQDGDTIKLGTSYTFSATGSVDPEGDTVEYYHFDFHDGTVEEFPGDEIATVSHTWTYANDDNEVKVTAYAFDKFAGFHHMSDGTEWTFTAEKSRDKNRPVMQNLMERFPIILHLLKL